MKELRQTKLFDPSGIKKGNCMATVIACLMECDIEDVPNVEVLMDINNNLWIEVLSAWLEHKGYEWRGLEGHQYDNSLYLVIGKSNRGVSHVCIYKNGELFFDPHPSNDGLLNNIYFEYFNKKK